MKCQTRQYMGSDPKRKLEIQPREDKRRNLYHPDDHRKFSHLFTSINWWSSQKGENHTQEHKQAEG